MKKWIKTDDLIVTVLAIVLVVGIALGVYFGIWLLWVWVVPQVWPTGPSEITRPDFWVFAGCWLLVSLVLKLTIRRR